MFNQEEQQTHMHEVLPTEQLEQIHKVVWFSIVKLQIHWRSKFWLVFWQTLTGQKDSLQWLRDTVKKDMRDLGIMYKKEREMLDEDKKDKLARAQAAHRRNLWCVDTSPLG